MQTKEHHAAEDQREAVDQETDRHPAKAGEHHHNKANSVPASQKVNAGKPRNCGQPIYAVKLHIYFTRPAPTTATASISTFASSGKRATCTVERAGNGALKCRP